tara:strand:+ start:597 stop:1052 length:456 start_codon:yes stop_codon:yes gene_type:complete
MAHRLRLAVWLSTLAFLIILAAVALQAALMLFHPDAGAVSAAELARRSPTLAYLYALWACRSAARRLQRGASFDDAIPALFTRMGIALVVGAALETFGYWWLVRLLEGGPGSIMAYDPATMTLGAVGALLLVLSGLWRQAGGMERELDEIV